MDIHDESFTGPLSLILLGLDARDEDGEGQQSRAILHSQHILTSALR